MTHAPIDGMPIEPSAVRVRPTWYPGCAACTRAWCTMYHGPASVPVEYALVVREGDELVLRVRCHGKRDRLNVTHATDERDLAALVLFRKGSK